MNVYVLIVFVLFMSNSISFADEGTYMRNVKSFRNWISPPRDYYIPLFKEDFDISKDGLSKEIVFKHNYEGNHSFGILLEHFSDDLYYVPLSKRYKLKLKMEINFYSNNELILTKKIENIYEPFIGDIGRGFSFFTYKVPQELPINKDIVVHIKILETDKYLFETYGPTKLYIEKRSDK